MADVTEAARFEMMLGTDATFTRRTALRAGALGMATLAVGAVPGSALADADVTQEEPLALGVYALNADWLFGGVYAAGDEASGASESGYATIAVPHTVTSLSWSEWDDSTWEQLWIYRKHLSAAALSGGRAFVDFQGAMTSATVYLNGTELVSHQGGYLPFTVELTTYLAAGDNVLAVVVDGTLQNVPPNDVASADGAGAIDYLQPAGINRDVALRIEPEVFVADVFAKPTNVLTSPGLDALVTVDAGVVPSGPVTILATVLDGQNVVGQASQQLTLTTTGTTQETVSITGLSGISLWSPESPTLYDVQVTLSVPGAASQVYATRTGFREAVFQSDGFYLNGSRYQIFGLNRHQLFPYTGMAAPQRIQRRDAEILRNELNCNMVRCSHYPQSDWFLDACDKLGLMVWEEPPGWGYVNNTASTGPAFKALVLQNVQDMIVRDRSRPSVIVWATRLNETSSQNNEALYAQTNQIAAQYDGTRQTTGAMNDYSVTDWNQQVFAYDDYTYSPMGSTDTDYEQNSAALKPPIEDANGNPLPYLVSESVGAIMGAPLYRWIDPSTTLGLQAKLHAQAHSEAGASGYAGLLGWCGVDYASTNGANINDATPPNGTRVWRNLKTPGVLDFFRVFKPGAAIYRAQTQADAAPVIFPAFVWDFNSTTNPAGPGANALVFTNCDSIRVTVSTGESLPAPTRLTNGYSNLAFPPFSLDLSSITSSSGNPELVITGLDASGNVLTTLQMSSDTSTDSLALTVDDAAIAADGTDATRFTIQATDAYGNPRPTPGGEVTLSITGSGATLISDNPFSFINGGAGGGFIQSQAGSGGTVTVVAVHPTLAPQGVSTTVTVGGDSPVPTPIGSGGLSPAQAPTPTPAAPTPPAPTPAPSTAATPAPTAATPAPATPSAGASVAATAHPAAVSVKPAATDAAIRTLLRRMLLPTGPASRLSRVLRDGYTLTFQAPSAGRLVVGWYTTVEIREAAPPHRRHRRRILVATATAQLKRAGRARVRLRLTAPGRTLLRHAKHTTLTAEATFTPKGRRRVSESRRIELRR
jgi:beta-galactosidase